MGIDNPVAAIGDKNVTVLALSDHHLPGNAAFRKCAGHGALRRRQAERNHFDRQRKTAENFDPFGIVGDHDHAIRGAGNDLLAQQRTAAALDDIERGIDFVGAVDGQVEPVDIVERGQRNAASHRIVAGRLRGRHAHDIESAAHPLTEQFDKMLRGRAGAEPELHAVANLLERTCRRLPFQCVHVHVQTSAREPPAKQVLSAGAYLASF